MKPEEFDPNSLALIHAFSIALETSCNTINFDLKCLDWFSYTPDFYIEQKNVKVA